MRNRDKTKEDNMSEWIEIKNPDDVELSEDSTTIDVLVETNEFGNRYIEIPVGFITDALAKQAKKCGHEDRSWFRKGEPCPKCE